MDGLEKKNGWVKKKGRVDMLWYVMIYITFILMFTYIQVQLYFYAPTIWGKKGPFIEPELLVFHVESMSNIPHGMITNIYPYLKSHYYKQEIFNF